MAIIYNSPIAPVYSQFIGPAFGSYSIPIVTSNPGDDLVAVFFVALMDGDYSGSENILGVGPGSVYDGNQQSYVSGSNAGFFAMSAQRFPGHYSSGFSFDLMFSGGSQIFDSSGSAIDGVMNVCVIGAWFQNVAPTSGGACNVYSAPGGGLQGASDIFNASAVDATVIAGFNIDSFAAHMTSVFTAPTFGAPAYFGAHQLTYGGVAWESGARASGSSDDVTGFNDFLFGGMRLYGSAVPSAINLSGTGSLVFNGSGSLQVATYISGTGGITFSGSTSLSGGHIPLAGTGSLTFSGDNPFNITVLHGDGTITFDGMLSGDGEMYPINVQPPTSAFSYGVIIAKTMTEAPNEALILNLEHHCRIDDPAQLNTGDWVQYTDPDLGKVFVGKIFRKKKLRKGGEGFEYTAANRGRAIQKTAARLFCSATTPNYLSGGYSLGTTRFHIPEGVTVSEALELAAFTVLDSGSNWFPLGINNELPSSLTDSVTGSVIGALSLFNSLDMAGQTVGKWFDAILDQTSGGCWNVEYQDSLGYQIRIYDFYRQPDYVIRLGSYSYNQPNSGPNTPVEVEAEIEENTDEKYYRVFVEGGGRWERKHSTSLALVIGNSGFPSCYDPPNCFTWETKARFYLPETNCDGWFFNSGSGIGNGSEFVCDREARLFYSYSFGAGSPIVITSGSGFAVIAAPIKDTDSLAVFVSGASTSQSNPYFCKYYFEAAILHGGVGGGGSGSPTAASFFNYSGDYTAYIGPNYGVCPSPAELSARLSPLAQLEEEGDYVVQRMDLVAYSQANYSRGSTLFEYSHAYDPSYSLQNIASCLYQKYGGAPNQAGPYTLHIHRGMTLPKPGMVLAQISADVRMRDFNYDFLGRNIVCNFANQPIREWIKEAKDKQVMKKSKEANWDKRQPSGLEPCIQGVVLYNRPDSCECSIVDSFPAGSSYGS